MSRETETAIHRATYLAVDFLIDRAGDPWLIEVNDLPDGPYMIRRINDALRDAPLPKDMTIQYNDPLQQLVELFRQHFKWSVEGKRLLRSVAIIYHNKYRYWTPRTELVALIDECRCAGIVARLYHPNECIVDADGNIMGRTDNCVSDLVFRRTSGVPRFACRQPIINDPRVRYVAGNKFATYLAVADYCARCDARIRQPTTRLAGSIEEVRASVESLEDTGCSGPFVIKPVWAAGGRGLAVVRGSHEVSVVSERTRPVQDDTCNEMMRQFIVQPVIASRGMSDQDGLRFAFEMRAFVYGGSVVAFIARRAHHPMRELTRSEIVCNVASGGRWVAVIVGGNEPIGELRVWDDPPSLPEPVDSTGICISEEVFQKMRRFSTAVVEAIDLSSRKVTREELAKVPLSRGNRCM